MTHFSFIEAVEVDACSKMLEHECVVIARQSWHHIVAVYESNASETMPLDQLSHVFPEFFISDSWLSKCVDALQSIEQE